MSKYPRQSYGEWAGNRKGNPYNPDRCAYEVAGGGRSMIFHQCRRPKGHGIDGLFCKQHAKMVKSNE